MLTQTYLKRVLNYDPETGLFTAFKLRPHPKGGTFATGGIDINGYVLIMVAGKQYKAHRLVWLWVYGKFPKRQIDHINGNRSDNRLINLRLATALENARSVRLSARNSSGFKGVSWAPRHKKWVAMIRVRGRLTYLGHYAIKEEAAKVYDEAAIEFFGSFAKTNHSLGLLK